MRAQLYSTFWMTEMVKPSSCKQPIFALFQASCRRNAPRNTVQYISQIMFVLFCFSYFPTCKVRVVRFYKSSSPPSSSSSSSSSPRQLSSPALHRSGHRGTSTVGLPIISSSSEWAAPDLNGEFQIWVGSAGPQPGTSRADQPPEKYTRKNAR